MTQNERIDSIELKLCTLQREIENDGGGWASFLPDLSRIHITAIKKDLEALKES